MMAMEGLQEDNIDIDAVSSDVLRLKEFVQERCASKLVANELNITIQKFEKMIESHKASASTALTLKVKTSENQHVVLSNISPQTSIRELVGRVESCLEQNIRCSSVKVDRTGLSHPCTHSHTIASCGLMNKDCIQLVDSTENSTSSTTDTKNGQTDACSNESLPEFMQPLVQSGVYPCSQLEAIAMACHSIILREGFICICDRVDDQPVVAGFAPPLSELPKGAFLPPNWRKDKDAIVILYKNKALSGKQFKLMCAFISEAVVAMSFTVKGGNSGPNGVNINTAEHCATSSDISSQRFPIHSVYRNPSSLQSIVRGVIRQVLSPEANATPADSGPAVLPQQYQSIPSLTPARAPDTGAHPLYGYGRGSTGMGVGRGDMEPPFPGMRPSIPTPSSGSVVGPDHPMFWGGSHVQGEGRDPFVPGFGPGAHVPRYDPIHPTPGVPMGGRNYVGGRTGRGRTVPGEPAPDHLRPPQYDIDDDSMYS